MRRRAPIATSLNDRADFRSGIRLSSFSLGGGGFATGRISSYEHRLLGGRLPRQLVPFAGLYEHTWRAEPEGLPYRWKSSSRD